MKPNPIDAQLGLISEADYVKFSGPKIHMIRNERASGGGPAYIKDGRVIKYSMAAIQAYIAARTIVPTRAPTLIDGKRSRRARRELR